MKIVIAAWHLQDSNVGLGRYCRELIQALTRVDDLNQYEILMPVDSCTFPARPNFKYRLIRFPVFRRRFWEQVAPLLSGQYHVLHFPYDSCVAVKRGKFVITVHDAKPFIFSSLKSRRNLPGLFQGLVIKDKWKQVDHVLTVSHSSRRDLVERLGLSESRVTVVYNGINRVHFAPSSPRGCVAQGRRPYVLTVAGNDPTKNLGTLVEAFAKLPDSIRNSYELVLAGDANRGAELQACIERVGLTTRVRFTGIVSEEKLVELYRQAALFVFPSLYEGFGLPVLEAMSCGCPVISSNASSLPEVAGQGAILVDPLDAGKLAQCMQTVLSNPVLQAEMRARGFEQASQFSWDRTARETLAVYTKVTHTHGMSPE